VQHFRMSLKKQVQSRPCVLLSGKRKGLLLNCVGVIPGEVPAGWTRSTRALEQISRASLRSMLLLKAGDLPGKSTSSVHIALVPRACREHRAINTRRSRPPDGSDERLQLGRQLRQSAASVDWVG